MSMDAMTSSIGFEIDSIRLAEKTICIESICNRHC